MAIPMLNTINGNQRQCCTIAGHLFVRNTRLRETNAFTLVVTRSLLFEFAYDNNKV